MSDYTKPEVQDYGTVADLTQNGGTYDGSDAKTGSGRGRGENAAN